MRGVCIALTNSESLRSLLDRGETDRELGDCELEGASDGEWMTASIQVQREEICVPVRVRRLGDDLRLVLSERDWQRLRGFASHCHVTPVEVSPASQVDPRAKGRVLVVSSERAVNHVVATTLRCAKIQADSATSGEEALRLVDSVEFDLLVIDAQLPDASVHALCQRLRNAKPECCPSVLLLAPSSWAGLEEGLLGGTADDFVATPFRCQELLARVVSLLPPAMDRRGWSGAA